MNYQLWEFELITPLERLVPSNRDETLERVSAQESHAVSTAEGCSLVNNHTQYPWRGPAFLRLRVKLAQTDIGVEGLGVHPGNADLTLKLKDVDPAEAPPLDANMSSKVRPLVGQVVQRSKPKHAYLKVKVENDVYCTYANRANSEFKYSPVPSNTNITTLAGVSEYFPDLPRFLGLPADFGLPLYSRRSFSKSVWDIKIKGVKGVANLVMNYPNVQAALLGSGAVSAELSFRLKRKDIEAVHSAGDDQYYDAVDEVIKLCELLHDEHWDQDIRF
ncbi:hypothetical protein COCOBI_10-5040 [Coccomyxa sp. Obi]|nr:hypothetical protein COCOBI_10-5040 [Coccomyxa sp. Obi]